MSEMIDRVAKALYARRPHYYSIQTLGEKGETLEPIEWDHLDNTLKIAFCQDARAAIAAVADDPDIQKILRWLDFKSCGWSPDEDTYKGARKLLDAFQVKDSAR